MLFLWIKAHLQELLHQVLLWHWAWLTVRHISEFTLLGVEQTINATMIVVWGWAILRHFRKRLCNKKLNESEV